MDLSIYNRDWTSFSGSVRRQGLCGACYAFAAVQSLESALAIHVFGVPMDLSVQRVIDCSFFTGKNFGCNGGYLVGSFEFLKLKGVVTEFAHPYTSGTTKTVNECKNGEGIFKISSYNSLGLGDCM